MSPALAGRFLTTAPPGKSQDTSIWINVCLTIKQNEMEEFIYHVSSEGALKVRFPLYCVQSQCSVKPPSRF